MPEPDNSVIETVLEYRDEIVSTKERLKVARERVKEERDGHSIAGDVDRLAEELKEARAKLKSSLMSDGDYNDACEEVAQLKAQLADQQDILSNYLVEHYRQTGEHQIELDPEAGTGREVVIKAKLGEEVNIQTHLFGRAGDGNKE
jgi:hypothetical protein